jgi:hypothetical protein
LGLRQLARIAATDADAFTDVDRSFWYDLIEELRGRSAAAHLRRASGKTGERSNLEGEASNLEGERSVLEGERDKSFGAGAG